MYKTELQEMCQQRRWGLPKYNSMKDGPDHSPRFKATVSVNSLSFDSTFPCKSSKDAQNDAAKLAFLHFSSRSTPAAGTYLDEVPKSHKPLENVDSNINVSSAEDEIDVSEEDYGFYKNLLQELAQREGFYIPLYKTIKSGASHMPTFFSSVEVEGEVFQGKAGKSKKEAEQKAAKVAFAALKERALCRSSGTALSPPAVDDTPKSTSSSEMSNTIHAQQSSKHVYQLLSSSTTKLEEHMDGSEEKLQAISNEMGPQNGNVSTEDSISSIAMPHGDKTIGNQNQSFSVSTPASSKEGLGWSPTLTHPNVSVLPNSRSNVGKSTGTRSYLLCNKVRVYPCFPDVAFPSGITVMPISDDRWVAVSLEFPYKMGS